MFKKAMMLAVAAAALVAFAIPATASAKWQDHNTALQANANITVTGQSKFQGQIGAVECQTLAAAQLVAGQTTANVTSFAPDITGSETVTDNCEVTGGLASLGCSDVASVTTEGFPWVTHATSTQTLAVTTGTIQNHLHGGIFCPKTQQLTPGTVHITTSTANTWTQGQLSGTLTVHSSGTESQVTISGTGAVTPSGTYGVV